jgi:hypothetical protein
VRLGGASVSILDMAALGALLAIGVGLARGDADPASLAGGGTGAFLLLLPALVAFVAAVACARLLAPLLRAVERAGRAGPLPVRLAALSLARSPGRTTVAAGFLVVSLGLALFAVVYRATLLAGQRDQAAYAVPADFVLSEDLAQLVPVTHVPPPPGDAIPVVRETGDVARLETSAGADVLGIPAGRIASLDGWRDDFSDEPLARLAASIRPAAPVSLATVPLRGRQLALTVTARGDPIGIRATVRLANGDFASVRIGSTLRRGTTTLRARLPPSTRALLGFGFELLNGGRASANAGTGIQPTANGRLALRSSQLRIEPAAWLPVGGVALDGDGLRYALAPDAPSGFRLRQETDGNPVPAIVTPALAHAAGPDRLLPFDVAGERIVLRIAGVATRFPGTTQADFVVADRGTLATALDAQLPGLGATSELWLDAPPVVARTLAGPPYDLLAVSSQRQARHQLAADPLARGALIVLAGTALVALCLALAGLLLGLVGDLRDERGELFDLESQGAPTGLLRLHLRLRAAGVAVFGALGGIATGVVLSALVLDLVRVTANLASPQPPLVLTVDWRLVALGAAVYVLLAAAAIVGATSAGFRPRAAGRYREVGA